MDGLGDYRLVRRRGDWAVAKGGRVVASYAGQDAAEAAAKTMALADAAGVAAERRRFNASPAAAPSAAASAF